MKEMSKLHTKLPLPLTLVAAVVLAASLPAFTQTAVDSRAQTDPVASTSAPSSDGDLRSEVDQLKQLVRDQQKRIDALETDRQKPYASTNADLTTSRPVDRAIPSSTMTATADPQVADKTNQNAGSSDERIRNLERQIGGLGPISFSGDVRLRAEPFFGGPSDESLDRARGRVRARFNATADLGHQFRAGLTLASGDINDPTSTNQTLTGFYTRKAIALDQAFVEFKPTGFKALTLVGGKFRYPWYNTELTWDKDLNPEGAGETLAFDLHTPILKRFALVGFQLPFAEMAGTATTDKRITQAITYGGQVQTTWKLAPHVNLSAYSGYYDFRGADSIALALARASSKNPQTPFSGVLPLTSGNPVQDSTYTTTATNVVTVGTTTVPTGVSTVTNAQFASKFGLFDNIARFDIDTGNDRLPVTFIGDFVQNTQACANLANIIPAAANSATLTYKQTVNAKCDAHERRGYWAEGTVGRLQKKGDFQLGYTRIFIEREAVLGNFNYSDIRQGTNVSQHRFMTFYQLDPSIQLGFTALVGRPLGTNEPWLTRLQFDTIYIF